MADDLGSSSGAYESCLIDTIMFTKLWDPRDDYYLRASASSLSHLSHPSELLLASR